MNNLILMSGGDWCNAGLKASPRFREATAYIKLRNQPPQVKYPLLALHIAANPQAYDAEPLNVRADVSIQPSCPTSTSNSLLSLTNHYTL